MSFDFSQTEMILPPEWSLKRVGDVAFVNSNTIKKKDEPTEIYYIDISSVSSGSYAPPTFMMFSEAPSRAKRRLQNNDFIISTVRPNLKQYAMLETVQDNWVCSTGFAVVSAMDKNTAWYLYSIITSDFFNEHLVRVADGGAYPAFNPKEIENALIPWPSENTLYFINDFAKRIDNKIELNRRTNQTLEDMAQAVFKSWFVDFDPTRAKIAAKKNDQDPERAAMAAIAGKTMEQLETLPPEQLKNLKSTAALFPDTLTDSDLGEIPEGWRWSEIGNEVTVVGGGTPSTKNETFWEGGRIHWTSPKDMSNLTDKILLDTNKKITEAGLGKISSGLLPKNTVLMSSRAPVGYLAISKIPVAINQGYIAMKCEKQLTPEYVVQWAESVMDEIKQRASGTTFAEISKKNFKIISVIVPENEVINKYSQLIEGFYEQITENLNETKSLTTIRDTLLPKLLSGEIDVSEAA